MYTMISTCPCCGAPIYLPCETSSGQPLMTESGLWRAVPEPLFTCNCRELVFASPAVDEAPLPIADEQSPSREYRRPRRASGYDAVKPFFSPGSKDR